MAGIYAVPGRQFVNLTRMGADGAWDLTCLANNLFQTQGLLPLPGRRVLIAHDGGQVA